MITSELRGLAEVRPGVDDQIDLVFPAALAS
jgi:hypothetical protein